jgi:hypothetical protein
MLIGLVIGYFSGIVTIILLSCCIVSGRESKREEQENKPFDKTI